MKYLQPSFTMPCSEHVSQEEWDRIFWSKETANLPQKYVQYYINPKFENNDHEDDGA